MALTRRKRYHNQTMRRSKIGPSTAAQSPIRPLVTPTTIVHAGNDLTVTFPQPMIQSGIPGWTNNGAHATGVSVTSPTVFVVHFSGATAAGAVLVPYDDPAFRTLNGGGYVTPGSLTAT
jgi:hypothetical protein